MTYGVYKGADMARILVVDDEELARFTICEMLGAIGHEAFEAKDGNEGIALQQAQHFDLVITDMIMPNKEGIETVIELKSEYPNLKIIAVSGGGRTHNMDFLELAGKYGADRVLQKPFSEKQLIECVNDCLA